MVPDFSMCLTWPSVDCQPFPGMETKISRLNDFLDDSQKVSWTVINGTGDSEKRTLVHKALSGYIADGQWTGGYAHIPDIPNYDQWWRQSTNTVMVFDRLSGYDDYQYLRYALDLLTSGVHHYARAKFRLVILDSGNPDKVWESAISLLANAQESGQRAAGSFWRPGLEAFRLSR